MRIEVKPFVPYSFKSEAFDLIHKARRSVEHLPTRFQMLRIADYIRLVEWGVYEAEERKKCLAHAKTLAAATRARNADPFGFKATRELMAAHNQ